MQTSTPISAELGLGDLVGPIEPFLQDNWNRLPLLHAALSPAQCEALLSRETLRSIVSDRHLRAPYVQVRGRYGLLHKSAYMRPLIVQGTDLGGVLDAHKVMRLLEAGATLSLDTAEHHHPPIQSLCTRLQEELRAPVTADILVTPPDGQGHWVHHDAEEFLILLHGTQRVVVHEQVRPVVSGATPQPDQNSLMDVELRPGDSMYIPYGFRSFSCFGTSWSYLLRVTVRPLSWGSIITSFISEVLESEIFEAVDLEVASLALSGAERLMAATKDLSTARLNRFIDEQVIAQAPRSPARSGFLRQADLRSRLSLDTVVSRNTSVSFDFGTSPNGSLLMRVDDRTYRYPAAAAEVLDLVRTFSRGRVSELRSGLATEAILKLVGHLIDNGILSVEAA